jgi:hypothetical protein
MAITMNSSAKKSGLEGLKIKDQRKNRQATTPKPTGMPSET